MSWSPDSRKIRLAKYIAYTVTEICEPPMSSSLFSVIYSWVSKGLLFLFVTTINSPNLYAMWLIYMYHLRSNYKNRLEFPFKWLHCQFFWISLQFPKDNAHNSTSNDIIVYKWSHKLWAPFLFLLTPRKA